MKISKKGGIFLFSLAGLLMALAILIHQNPGPSADPQEELLKKALSCGVILIACLVFAKWYEKFTTSEMASATSRCATSEVRIGKRAMADYAFSLCHEA